MENSIKKEFLTTRETCDRLGVSDTTLARLVKDKVIERYKAGFSYLFITAHVELLRAERKAKKEAKKKGKG